ncbi:MAG: hypothetical protein FJ102_24180 [Deltaproteobacteria bacterium]|nr:hypothetical protein [Deltaproteobacteria bacterium]
MSRGLYEHLGATTPDDWPSMQAPGEATTWHCGGGYSQGIRIHGDQSLRCSDETCGTWIWAVPPSLDSSPVEADAGDVFEAWSSEQDGGGANWFLAACEDK